MSEPAKAVVIEAQPRPAIHTLVASFLFTDLVGFSKGTAADQYAAKAKLSAALRRHLSPLRESDYWIKDTGDGALIAFVSNPEHALYMALALGHDYSASGDAEARLRTGLHLGTVKDSIDVEGRRNFVGDGINAAKRIMDFAIPGQIAASRSFFEAIGNLDAAYAALFQHLGAPDDKHGRAHELYALAPSDSVLEKLRADLAAESTDAPAPAGEGAQEKGKPSEFAHAATATPRLARPAILVGLAVALGIAAVWAVTGLRESPSPANPKVDVPGAPASADALGSKSDRTAAPASTVPSEPPPTPSHVAPPTQVMAPPIPAVAEPHPNEPAPRSPQSMHTGAAAPSLAAKSAINHEPRVSVPPSNDAAAAGPSGPRCSRILEKAALGEPLTPDEKRELANTCH